MSVGRSEEGWGLDIHVSRASLGILLGGALWDTGWEVCGIADLAPVLVWLGG